MQQVIYPGISVAQSSSPLSRNFDRQFEDTFRMRHLSNQVADKKLIFNSLKPCSRHLTNHLFRKICLLSLLAASSFLAGAQNDILPTDQIKITGKVKQELTIRLADLAKYPAHRIKSFALVNHKGEKKADIKNLRGIRITDLLQPVEFATDSPKQLSEYYLVFVASDGYKVVYSWNEIFNSPTGLNTWVVTSKEGIDAANMPERILVVSPGDIHTGRRYLKGLTEIRVETVK